MRLAGCRSRTPLRLVRTTIAVLLLVANPAIVADEAERAEREAELEALEAEIAEVRDALTRDRGRRDDVSVQIERSERRIAEIAGEIRRLDADINTHEKELAELEVRSDELASAIAAHEATLAGQLRSMHRMGGQPGIRMLLRQDDPERLSRATAYMEYLNRARLDAIDESNRLLDEAESVRKETETAHERLANARDALAEQREQLQATRIEREELLARLEREIAERGDRLERMEADRRRLEELLERLGSLLADIPESPLEAEPFESRSGRLAWPTEGSVRQRFGSERSDGRLRWQGLVIEADIGRPVEAVYHGRVVFADWLSGFGQLMIIDHQDGYMSLYGFNERLLRSEGDWVRPGEPIAAVGDSGGRRAPALYFEIRHQGRPVDPLPWLAGG